MRKTSEVIINGIPLDKILSEHLKWLYNKGGCKADLSSANLSWANLSWANLSCANLSGVDLSNADLSNANLSGANLSGSVFCGTDLSFAKLDDTFYQVSRIGSYDRMTTYNATKDIVWCGCFKGTMKEFKENVECTHKNNPRYLAQYRAVIDYFNSLANIKNDINNQQRN